MTGTDKNTLPFLMASLKEVQDTVRAYDTKAQIVGVGYIFAIGIIFNLGGRIANMPEMTTVTITFAWLVFIFPIALFGAVLYPSRKAAPSLGEKGTHADRTFYVAMRRSTWGSGILVISKSPMPTIKASIMQSTPSTSRARWQS